MAILSLSMLGGAFAAAAPVYVFDFKMGGL